VAEDRTETTRTDAKAAADARADAAEAERVEKAEAKAAKAAKGKLARAAESGDPAVQKLMAEREGHSLNIQPDPSLHQQREAAENAIKSIDEQLERLGFTAE
jgi:hypothetical protein